MFFNRRRKQAKYITRENINNRLIKLNRFDFGWRCLLAWSETLHDFNNIIMKERRIKRLGEREENDE